MAKDQRVRGGGTGSPPDAGDFLTAAKAQLNFDALVLAIIEPAQPRPEGFLAVHEVDAAAIKTWCRSAGEDGGLVFARALQAGAAAGKGVATQDAPPLPPGQHSLVQVVPASLDGGRVWMLGLSRLEAPFSEAERRAAGLLLRLKQLDFDHCPEPDLGKLLLDADRQLIHADPRSDAYYADHPQRLDDLVSLLDRVHRQRWPEDPPIHPTRDVVLPTAEGPVWVRFTACAPAPGLPPHRYLELRPVEPQDAPPVGLVEDDRIARAMAYLTDHYPESPSLSDAAAAVHTSAFHFHRLFSREVGVSPKHYLLRTQLQMAKWMLRATRRPVGEVAAATGFASHGHFTATFHRIVGVSPSNYRERQWTAPRE